MFLTKNLEKQTNETQRNQENKSLTVSEEISRNRKSIGKTTENKC